jgi:hypothetical protein
VGIQNYSFKLFPFIDLFPQRDKHAICLECRGTGYPDLWPSPSCREPLDVTKNVTFDVISGILTG